MCPGSLNNVHNGTKTSPTKNANDEPREHHRMLEWLREMQMDAVVCLEMILSS